MSRSHFYDTITFYAGNRTDDMEAMIRAAMEQSGITSKSAYICKCIEVATPIICPGISGLTGLSVRASTAPGRKSLVI